MIEDETVISAVDDLLKQFPTLDIHGLCVPSGNKGQTQSTRDEIIKDALALKCQIDWCAEWLDMCPKTKTFHQPCDSYVLKHEIEQWRGRTGRSLSWVSHMSFLLAAHVSGLELKQRSGKHYADRRHTAILKLSEKRPGSSWDMFRLEGDRAVPPWLKAHPKKTPIQLLDGRCGVIRGVKERDEGVVEYYVILNDRTKTPYWYGTDLEFSLI